MTNHIKVALICKEKCTIRVILRIFFNFRVIIISVAYSATKQIAISMTIEWFNDSHTHTHTHLCIVYTQKCRQSRGRFSKILYTFILCPVLCLFLHGGQNLPLHPPQSNSLTKRLNKGNRKLAAKPHNIYSLSSEVIPCWDNGSRGSHASMYCRTDVLAIFHDEGSPCRLHSIYDLLPIWWSFSIEQNPKDFL